MKSKFDLIYEQIINSVTSSKVVSYTFPDELSAQECQQVVNFFESNFGEFAKLDSFLRSNDTPLSEKVKPHWDAIWEQIFAASGFPNSIAKDQAKKNVLKNYIVTRFYADRQKWESGVRTGNLGDAMEPMQRIDGEKTTRLGAYDEYLNSRGNNRANAKTYTAWDSSR